MIPLLVSGFSLAKVTGPIQIKLPYLRSMTKIICSYLSVSYFYCLYTYANEQF